MQLQIESTEQITDFDGVPVRVWNGTTPSGIPCFVFVHRVAVSNEVDQAQFERELQEQLPPGPPRVVPLSAIL